MKRVCRSLPEEALFPPGFVKSGSRKPASPTKPVRISSSRILLLTKTSVVIFSPTNATTHHCENLFSIPLMLVRYERFKTYLKRKTRRDQRSARPHVTLRKIFGGTRSDKGSSAMAILSSLFSTWTRRNQDPLARCIEMMRGAQRCSATTSTPA